MPTIKVRAILAYASFVFPVMADAVPQFLAANAFRMNGTVALRTLPEAVYLIFVTPTTVDGLENKESVVRQAMENALALCLVVMGKGIAFEHIFDNELTLDGSGITITGPSHDNPWWLGKPNIEQDIFQLVAQAERSLFSLTEHEQNRAVLSMRWFSMAIYGSGVDSFLKYWIAIETIAMPNTTNIRTVVSTLAKAYGISSNDLAKDKFLIGRLFRLRGRIVHEGELVTVSPGLLLYMQGLYADILFQFLKIPILCKADEVLSNSRTNDFVGLLKQL